MSEITKKGIHDFGTYFIGTIAVLVAGFISVPIYTRLFEPDIYGKLILAQTTIGFLSILSIGWIAPSIVRFFPKYDLSEKNRFYSTFFTMLSKSVLIISIFFFIVIFILKNRMDTLLYNLLLIGIFVFISSSFYSIFLDIFRAPLLDQIIELIIYLN